MFKAIYILLGLSFLLPVVLAQTSIAVGVFRNGLIFLDRNGNPCLGC
jgi:hypothetical protein